MGIFDKIKTAAGRARKASAEFDEAVESLRTHLFELSQERERVTNAPLSRAEIEANIDAFLDAAVAEARSALIPSAFVLPPDQYRVKPDLAAPFRASQPGATVLLYGRATARANLLNEALAAAKALGEPLSVVEREAEFARIDTEIDITERAEEELIRAAEDAGFKIWRRPDARPEIYLADDL